MEGHIAHYGLYLRQIEADRIRELEEGRTEQLRLGFNRWIDVEMSNPNIISVVVQDVDTREVLLLASADSKALEYTLRNRRAAFWSVSRKKVLGQGRGVRELPGGCRGPGQLRAELATIPGPQSQGRRVPH